MRFLRTTSLAILTFISIATFNVNADPVFYPERGELVLPNLNLDGEKYYVVLKQVPGTLNFRVDESSISNITLAPGNGSPSSPKLINFDGENTLFSNIFFNYYHLNAVKGQKLIVNTMLNQALSTQQKTRCASNSGTGPTASSYDTQIHVLNSTLTRIGGICGESLTFQFPETGRYVLHFDYASQSAGIFNAAIQ